MGGLVCPGSAAGCNKKPVAQKELFNRLLRRTRSLSYTGLLAGSHNGHLRPSAALFVFGRTVAVIRLFGALCCDLFDGFRQTVSKSVVCSAYRSVDMGFIGIYPVVFSLGLPLGADGIYTIQPVAYYPNIRYFWRIRRVILYHLRQYNRVFHLSLSNPERLAKQ